MHAVRRCIRHALLALVLAAALGAALSSGVRADSHDTCVLDGLNVMAFGQYDPMSNNALDMQGRVSYRCFEGDDHDHVDDRHDHEDGDHGNGSSTVQISLSAGHAGRFNRYMSGPGDRLDYNLYMDPQRQTVWGDGTGGTRVYSARAQFDNHLVTVPVYGRIFGAQDIRAGIYLDSLIVTLDF
jgi:spore coat protein U-like protein